MGETLLWNSKNKYWNNNAKNAPEMLRFVPDHRKSKRVCKNAVKKLPFVIKYVPDQYKTIEMFDKVIIENVFIPDRYKHQKMCDKLFITIAMHQDLSLTAVRPRNV